MYGTTQIIAEVKTKDASRNGFRSPRTWDELFEIANEVGDIISVHTNKIWDGSFELVKKARLLTNKPILAKGIHENDSLIEQAIDAGADWVLVLVGEGRKLPTVHIEKCMIEPYTLHDLETIPAHMKVVWNSRDVEQSLKLKREVSKRETFQQARAMHEGWLCQASNLRTVADIKAGADAVLVGTHLPEFAATLTAE